jgi:hypothetical protein
MGHKLSLVLAALITACIIIVSGPSATSEPAASPADRAREDLSRFEYPSQAGIKWQPHFIMPHESLERLFGANWICVARFNRIDRRHVYPGMTIKAPENIEAIKNYNPLPLHYEPAEKYPKYILIDVKEQWLAAYEYGALKFSMPAATGIEGHLAPTGIFKIDARHKNHTSSLYKTQKGDTQYPMDYAVRFYVDPENVAYWIHARDLPGRPASHGCIGVFDEFMQKRTYRWPEKPVLSDASKLYYWVDENRDEDESRITYMEDGPTVEIRGELPKYLDAKNIN